MYVVRGVDLDTGEVEVHSKHEMRFEAEKVLAKLAKIRKMSRHPNGQYPMPVHHIVTEN